jgi:hypothetical protein
VKRGTARLDPRTEIQGITSRYRSSLGHAFSLAA